MSIAQVTKVAPADLSRASYISSKYPAALCIVTAGGAQSIALGSLPAVINFPTVSVAQGGLTQNPAPSAFYGINMPYAGSAFDCQADVSFQIPTFASGQLMYQVELRLVNPDTPSDILLAAQGVMVPANSGTVVMASVVAAKVISPGPNAYIYARVAQTNSAPVVVAGVVIQGQMACSLLGSA
jgi:hypothetical protein